MNHSPRLDAEKLVEIHKAHDEWEGNLLIGFLRDNDIQATFPGELAVNLDPAHMSKSADEVFGVYVLEENAARARELVHDFLTTATDETVLDEMAAHKLRVSKETITQLRGALKDERETFEFLGWIGVVFLGAAALLWVIWPEWLKMDAPPALFRWAMVLVLALGAVFAGSWASRRL